MIRAVANAGSSLPECATAAAAVARVVERVEAPAELPDGRSLTALPRINRRRQGDPVDCYGQGTSFAVTLAQAVAC